MTVETTIQVALISRRASKYIPLVLVQAYKAEGRDNSVLFHSYFKNVREYINSEVKFDNSSAFGLLHIYLQKPSHLIQHLAFQSKST